MPGHDSIQRKPHEGRSFEGNSAPPYLQPDQQHPVSSNYYRSDHRSGGPPVPPRPHYGMSGPQAPPPPRSYLPRDSNDGRSRASHWVPVHSGSSKGGQDDCHRPSGFGGAYMDGRDPRDSHSSYADSHSRPAPFTDASSAMLDYGRSPPPRDHSSRRWGPGSTSSAEQSKGGSHRRQRDDESYGRGGEARGEPFKRPRLESDRNSSSGTGEVSSRRLRSPPHSASSALPPRSPHRALGRPLDERGHSPSGTGAEVEMDDHDNEGSVESGEIEEKPVPHQRLSVNARPLKSDSGGLSATEPRLRPHPSSPAAPLPTIHTAAESSTTLSSTSAPYEPSPAIPPRTVGSLTDATLPSDGGSLPTPSLSSPALPISPTVTSAGRLSPSSPPLMPPSPGTAAIRTVKIKRPSAGNGGPTGAVPTEVVQPVDPTPPATASGGKTMNRPLKAGNIFGRAMLDVQRPAKSAASHEPTLPRSPS